MSHFRQGFIMECGFNPQLELSFKPNKSIAAVAQHLCQKWSDKLGEKLVAHGYGVRNPVFRIADVKFPQGWGKEDKGVAVSAVYILLGRPTEFRMSYM
jgi:hypothetical protein